MEKKLLQPDPTDYQIIAMSNCLQLASCFCDILACFMPEFRDAAAIIDLIADCFTCSVGGCMAAQISAEVKKGPRLPHMPGGVATANYAVGGPAAPGPKPVQAQYAQPVQAQYSQPGHAQYAQPVPPQYAQQQQNVQYAQPMQMTNPVYAPQQQNFKR
eukprot:g5445.t1